MYVTRWLTSDSTANGTQFASAQTIAQRASLLRALRAAQAAKRSASGTEPARIGLSAPRKSIDGTDDVVLPATSTLTATRRYWIWHSLNGHCHGTLLIPLQTPSLLAGSFRREPYSIMCRIWSIGLVNVVNR